MATTPTSKWLCDEGVRPVPTTFAQFSQSCNSRDMNIMGGYMELVAKIMGCSSSKSKLNSKLDVVDLFITNQMLQGNRSGFDIIMAHEDEETLAVTLDGPKRSRIKSPASRISIADSNDVSVSVSVGLAQ
ncbi:hypothetical protein V6N11_071319 [Hibiscus sabdariffa]|uniref:Uncharacterized protein n=1 Tax=Hibiscus sabdariffa TaxID=183260 RepID=A0ABR2U0C4_9ROSI